MPGSERSSSLFFELTQRHVTPAPRDRVQVDTNGTRVDPVRLWRAARTATTSLLPMAIESDGAELGAVLAELVERAVARG